MIGLVATLEPCDANLIPSLAQWVKFMACGSFGIGCNYDLDLITSLGTPYAMGQLKNKNKIKITVLMLSLFFFQMWKIRDQFSQSHRTKWHYYVMEPRFPCRYPGCSS